MKTYLVTGGAGFIGSNFVLYMLKKYQNIRIINLDKLTYAGNLENLKSIQDDPKTECSRIFPSVATLLPFSRLACCTWRTAANGNPK